MSIPKTKTATVFRESLYETLKEVSKGSPYLITQKSGDNVVLISQDTYNKILHEQEILRDVAAGVRDLESGKTLTHEDAVSKLRKLQKKWK